MAESPYDILGVAKDASAYAIRKAYRKLARKHHPDVNPGNKKSEESFKRITAANEILSDEKKRKAYDEFGEASLQSGFDADKAREYSKWQNTRQQRAVYDEGPIDFDFSQMFGGGRPRARGPSRGSDVQATVPMDLRQAIEGGEVSFDIPGQGMVRVRIPPGADNGSTVRVAGKGAPGGRGGPPGDLLIEILVQPHPVLRREGLDLTMTVPVDLDEAYNGASIEIPTFDGPVMLKVPPRSQTGTKLRLRGKGIKRKETRGDLFVELSVRMPDGVDDKLAEALRASKAAYSAPVRAELTL